MEPEISDELLSNPSVQVVTRVKPIATANITQPSTFNNNEFVEYKGETKGNVLFVPNMKNDLTQPKTDKYIIQDPYLLPPPYQKNFEYQTLQPTEAIKELKGLSDKVEYKQLGAESQLKGYGIPHPMNSTTPVTVHVPASVYNKYNKNYPYKDSYPMPSSHKNPVYMSGPSKYQVPPPMHIHIIKHADPNNDRPQFINKQYMVGRPYRHSVVIKKPLHKVKPYYPPPSMQQAPIPTPQGTKIPKQSSEQQAAGSTPVKSVLPAVRRKIVPKIAQSQAHSSIPKKPYMPHVMSSRKKEEPVAKQQHYAVASKVEEQPVAAHSEVYSQPAPLSSHGGFNPNSIVIESGFKPIIPSTENQHMAQERMSEDEEDYIEQDARDLLPENETVSDDHSKNPFEGKEPELFEPIFIPSPLINEQQRKKKPTYEDGLKLKLHKPNQPNIVYIWPNEETSNVPAKQPAYYNYYATDAIAPPVFSGYEKNEPVSAPNENVVEASSYAQDSASGVFQADVNNYNHKGSDYYDTRNLNPEISDVNNSTEKVLQSAEKSNVAPNHKVKYIPVSYNLSKDETENEDKLIINLQDEPPTEPFNSTTSS